MEIISRQNSKVVHARNLGRNRSYRQTYNQFLCDGIKMLEEAIQSSARIECIFAASKPDLTLPEAIPVYEVKQEILEYISPLKNAQDIIFICNMKTKQINDFSTGIHILLENIQDPGNVGTILRSAYAFGIESVIMTPGCADPYNPKAIRASMGAIFKQNHCYKEFSELQNLNVRIIGTANKDEYLSICEIQIDNAVIVIGNEGQGISKDVLKLCESMITIPTAPGCESLNAAVAASIIMWELSRSITKKEG